MTAAATMPIDWGLWYAGLGIPVLPLHTPGFDETDNLQGCSCGNHNCHSQGKHPRMNGGCHAATTDEQTIRHWWERWPDANIGIATGTPSNIVIVDVDPRNGGDESLNRMLRDQILHKDTVLINTGGGGWHFYFQLPAEGLPSSKLGTEYPGIDIKAEGGYVVAPPSRHASGGYYEFFEGHGFHQRTPAPFPDDLLEIIRKAKPKNKSAVKQHDTPDCSIATSPSLIERRTDRHTRERARRYIKQMGPAIEGSGGDDHSYKVACVLIHDFWLDLNITWQLFVEWNETCKPPWGEPDLKRFIENALKYAAGEPGHLAFDVPAEHRAQVLAPGVHRILGDTEEIQYKEVRSVDFTREVLGAIPPDQIYLRGSLLGRILDGRFRPLDANQAILVIDSWCAVYKLDVATDGEGKDKKPRQTRVWKPTTKQLAELVIAAAQQHVDVRELRAIVSYPVFAGPGFELSSVGWNQNSGIYYAPAYDLAGLKPARGITREQVHAVFQDLLVDFPFASEADRQNFIGLLVTPFIYHALQGLAPFFVADASRPGSGKGYLIAKVLGIILLGQQLVSSSLVPDLSEFRKQLTTILMTGRPYVFFDNIAHHVDNAILARFLTEPIWSDRVLGLNRNFEAEQKSLTLGTANNFTASDEIARRVVPIRLEPAVECPELRQDFKHPDLTGYLHANRLKVVETILGMVEAWKAADQPLATIPFGSFEEWAGVVGGLLQHFGFAEFLSNRATWTESAQAAHEDEIHDMVKVWANAVEVGKRRTCKDLLKIIRGKGVFEDIFLEPSANHTKILGKRLQRHRGRVVGQYVIQGRRSSGRSYWWLEKCPSVGATPSHTISTIHLSSR